MQKHRHLRQFLALALAIILTLLPMAPPAAQAAEKNEAVLSTSTMDVRIDKKFPRVIKYTMKSGKEKGQVFYGQSKKLNTVLINGVSVKPSVKTTVTKAGATYVMTCKDEAHDIDAVITAKLSVKNNILTFKITEINDNKIVNTIEFPNHNLISVRSTQKSAVLDAVNISVNTHVNGDRQVKVNKSLDTKAEAKKGYAYAILSTDQLSASIFTNAETSLAEQVDPTSYEAKIDAQRIIATATAKSSYKELGLSSNAWVYQKTSEHRKENGTLTQDDGSSFQLKDEMPCAKIVITGDANADKKIDWQDGAIAFRDIMNNPLGYESVPDLVAYRVNMNFGSQAQNPFLTALDGVKKVYLHTDGLGQSVLLKGYGSEGHDSGHLNYADINTRAGGAEEMKALLEKGKEYGAVFGIHVNASETYPESKYFDEDRLRKRDDGTFWYGWNWIDQGVNIDADYDLRHGRAQRFKDLYDELGGENNNLDFVYVDVWGNGQSGNNGPWASRQLAKEINGLGWRLAGEWGYAHEYNSTFQHWAADLTYGGYTLKGINSTIVRFIRNHQKDSWIGDYPSYGGAADAPLLGGYDMKDFEGWQRRADYGAYMKKLFGVNIPTKFVQHYMLTKWTDGKAVTMTDHDETYQWTPGMKAVLKDASGKNKLVITRESNDYKNNVDGYRTRTMTLNGKKVFYGKPGSETYLLPWNWGTEEKLYHFNAKGGKTTWEVPDGWNGEVKVYELTELGKQNEENIAIENGKITLTAKESTLYVVLKSSKDNKDVNWSDGMHLTDVGFNSGNLDNWTITGDAKSASVTKSEGSNNMLTIKDSTADTSLTQTVTELKANTKYAVYVGVENRSDAAARMTVVSDGKEFANYTNRSIALNYIGAYAHHTGKIGAEPGDGQTTSTADGLSYFQNMYVFFETGSNPADTKLTLSRDAGEGTSYFDDIRIVETKANNFESETVFRQDFENVAQGIYPFVVGCVEDVEDNRTHLAEYHAPYTQRDWNGKVISDVINGNWSLKTNGLCYIFSEEDNEAGRYYWSPAPEDDRLLYQTIPQNFRFEPGVTYKVTFKYEAGSNDTYEVVVGNKPYSEHEFVSTTPLKATASDYDIKEAGTYTFEITGDASGQTWFGIQSNKNAVADPREFYNTSQADFNGYFDIVLDDLVIEKITK